MNYRCDSKSEFEFAMNYKNLKLALTDYQNWVVVENSDWSKFDGICGKTYPTFLYKKDLNLVMKLDYLFKETGGWNFGSPRFPSRQSVLKKGWDQYQIDLKNYRATLPWKTLYEQREKDLYRIDAFVCYGGTVILKKDLVGTPGLRTSSGAWAYAIDRFSDARTSWDSLNVDEKNFYFSLIFFENSKEVDWLVKYCDVVTEEFYRRFRVQRWFKSRLKSLLQ